MLFAYRASLQESTQESPFFLLYGRDPRLPSELCLEVSQDRQELDLDDYSSELMMQMSEAWELAKNQIVKAQKTQK